MIFPKTALKIAIWVFFRGLKSKSGYFKGFPKMFPTSVPITSTLRVPPPGFSEYTLESYFYIILGKAHPWLHLSSPETV